MNLVFDLDGTLICSKKRLHSLFCFLTDSNKIGFDEYWSFKFQGLTNQQILSTQLNFKDDEIENFVAKWMTLIESDEYLAMDTALPNIHDYLNVAAKNNKLFICTARQFTSKAIAQVERLKLAEFFTDIFVTNQTKSKEQLLKNSGRKFSNTDWFIGDTGHDIKTGQVLGMNTCAVLTGFMSKAQLCKYSPSLFKDSSVEFLRSLDHA